MLKIWEDSRLVKVGVYIGHAAVVGVKDQGFQRNHCLMVEYWANPTADSNDKHVEGL